MADNDFKTKNLEPVNPAQKCFCVLCLDVSGSMFGEPIDELNSGLKKFREEVIADDTASERVEVCIVTFSSSVNVEMEPRLMTEISDMPELTSNGSTKLVDGVRKAISKVEEQKKFYKDKGLNYYRPWIILMTDGEPDSDQDINGLAKDIKNGEDQKRFIFFAFGVQDANMNMLKSICNKYQAEKLKGINFTEFFQWLSASMGVIVQSAPEEDINLPKPIWAEPFTT
jgi:uncharacterized protein YegL